MTVNVSLLQGRLDSLRAARDSGVLMVRHGDTTTQFRSMLEITQAITQLQRDINNALGVKRGPKYIFQTTKAL